MRDEASTVTSSKKTPLLNQLSNDRIFSLKRVLDSHNWFFSLPSNKIHSNDEEAVSSLSDRYSSSRTRDSEPSRKKNCEATDPEPNWAQFMKEQEVQ
jgi:hypothetical protein